jgi:hypothetical protein
MWSDLTKGATSGFRERDDDASADSAVDCSCDDELVRQSIEILLYSTDPESLGRSVRSEGSTVSSEVVGRMPGYCDARVYSEIRSFDGAVGLASVSLCYGSGGRHADT